MFNIPAVVGNKYINTLDKYEICSLRKEPLASMSLFPVIRLHEIKNRIKHDFDLIQSLPAQKIFEVLKKAAKIYRAMDFDIDGYKINREVYTDLVSRCTGLPKKFVDSEIDEVANFMDNLEAVVSVQLPGGSAEVLDNHYYTVNDNKVGYYPAGKSVVIRIPGNVPTICIYWLIPLAQKRSIILIPPKEEPLTHFLILEAIRLADPVLASLVNFVPCNDGTLNQLISFTDQLMISESAKDIIGSSEDVLEKTYFIHYGRSKFILDDAVCDDTVDIIYGKMTWNCGRTCTGLTSVIAKGNAEELAHKVAAKFKGIAVRDLESKGIAPLFDSDRANQMNDMLERYVQKGDAQDITQEVTGHPRLAELENGALLLPTIMLVKNKNSDIFGLELPFPFITIIDALDNDEMIEFAKNSLILSVLSDNKALVQELCYENTILKVFSGEFIERGYNYYDPHEGYIADFTYRKKAVLY